MASVVADTVVGVRLFFGHQALMIEAELEVGFREIITYRLVNRVENHHFGNSDVRQLVDLVRIEHFRAGCELAVDHDVRQRRVELHAGGDCGVRGLADFELRFDEVFDFLVDGLDFPRTQVAGGIIVEVDRLEEFTRVAFAGKHFGDGIHDLIFHLFEPLFDFYILLVRIFHTEHLPFRLPVSGRRVDMIRKVQPVFGHVTEDGRDVGTPQYPADGSHECRCRIKIPAERIGIVVGCTHGILSRIERVVNRIGLYAGCETRIFKIAYEDVLHVF